MAAHAEEIDSALQAEAERIGKEAVSGNILIWFLCAIAFLKISQKIDSFMSSLGINVGHTGGSMLGEMMIATKVLKSSAGRMIGGGGNGVSLSGKGNGPPIQGKTSGSGLIGPFSGGLAGMVGNRFKQIAVQHATQNQTVQSNAANSVHSSSSSTSNETSNDASSSSGAAYSSSANSATSTVHTHTGGIGGKMFSSSVEKGGSFANSVISSIATGNFSTMGSITGDKAIQSYHSYMGSSGNEGTPSVSNVEIGGGRITGTEMTAEYPSGIAFGMYHSGQYMAPEGEYSKVKSADGNEWYKQYAVDAVEKTPFMTPNGDIAYKQNMVKKLPPMPKRKDRL